MNQDKQPMFVVFYNGVGDYSELDIRRTLISYCKYTLKNKHLPKFKIEN